MDILDHIAVVPNFPKPGINFYDIQSLMIKPAIWVQIIEDMSRKAALYNPDIVLGIESRGFLTGLPVAQSLNIPFGMIRKKGKLPGEVLSQTYDLEYGSDCIEIQKNIIRPGAKFLIVDDLLATGGTMAASGDLIRNAGGKVAGGLVLIELTELCGRNRLDFPFEALAAAPLDPK